MDMNEYQQRTRETASYPEIFGLEYSVLKLNGEAGEVAELLGKMFRDDNGSLSHERRENMIKELGDTLWYVACVAHELHITLEEVAERNLAKLADRKARGVLHGDGDNR